MQKVGDCSQGFQYWLHIRIAGVTKKITSECLNPTSRDGNLVGLGLGLDNDIFKSSPGDPITQQGWEWMP